MILSRDEILINLEESRVPMASAGVSRIGLFGSYAKGSATELSDIDFLVEFKEGQKKFQNLLRVSEILSALFPKKIEIVTDASLASFMKKEVEKSIAYVSYTD